MVDELFKDRKPNIQKLLSFGFAEQNDIFSYSENLADGQFKMIVSISRAGTVNAAVWDCKSDDQYVLHRVPGAHGSFVGRIRSEYEALLLQIAENCFDKTVFKSEYAKALIRYVRDTYRDELEYLWKKFPNNAIWRRKDNAKWYAALLTVSKEKLGMTGTENTEIIDLRAEPETLVSLIDGQKYFPGYHMNKKHWFTICLDGSVPLDEIFRRLDTSYQIASKKR